MSTPDHSPPPPWAGAAGHPPPPQFPPHGPAPGAPAYPPGPTGYQPHPQLPPHPPMPGAPPYSPGPTGYRPHPQLPPHAPMPGAPPYPPGVAHPHPALRRVGPSYARALGAAAAGALAVIVVPFVVMGVVPSGYSLGELVGRAVVPTLLAALVTWAVLRDRPWPWWGVALVALPFFVLFQVVTVALSVLGRS